MVEHLRKVRSHSGQQGLKSKKKRRRRSHQPIRERRRRRLVMAAAFLLIVLPLATFVAGSFLFSYMAYKGERFRKEMSLSVSEALGFQGEFEDKFSVSRLTIKNRRFSATGSDRSVLAAFDAQNLEARLRASSYFSKEWRLPHLVADRANLHLRPLPPGSGSTDSTNAAVLQEALNILVAGLGFSGVPDEYDIQRVSVRNLNADFGANLHLGLAHTLEGLHLTANRTQSGYLMNIDRGRLRYFYWPLFEVQTADLSFDSAGTLTIYQSSLITENKVMGSTGTAAVSGTIHFGENPSINLSIEVSNLEIDTIVNEQHWSDRIMGHLNGEFTIAGDLTMDNLPTITGKINSPDLSIKNLPALHELSVRCGIAELKRIEFDLFEAKFHQEGNTIRVHDIYGMRPSLAGITGEFTVHPNHTMEGNLEVGLPDSTLEKMGSEHVKGRPSFFKPRADGINYGWAEINVTGTLASPIDNLTRMFEAYFSGSDSINPREFRRSTTFQRPQPLHQGPTSTYHERLDGLFKQYIDASLADPLN